MKAEGLTPLGVVRYSLALIAAETNERVYEATSDFEVPVFVFLGSAAIGGTRDAVLDALREV